MTIRTGRSAIPVSAVSLSQINLCSLHTKRTQQGIRESMEMLELLPITISSSELLSVRQRFSYSRRVYRRMELQSNFRIPRHDCVTSIACSRSPAVRIKMNKVEKIE